MPRVTHSTRLARRALRTVKDREGEASARELVVTDVVAAVPGAQSRSVVFLEQRWMGLPIYGSRRSVIFSGRRKFITGKRLRVRACRHLLPEKTAEAAAVRVVLRADPKLARSQVETVARSPGQDRFTVIRVGDADQTTMVSLHLSVHPTGRLAWVATMVVHDGRAFEVVLDATTLKMLVKRELSQSGTACLHIAAAAGGPAPDGTPVRLPFQPHWLDPLREAVVLRDGQGTPVALPLPSNGDYCGTVQPDSFAQVILNAYAIANAGLDTLLPHGGKAQGTVLLTILNATIAAPDKVAVARPDLVRPQLRFAKLQSNRRHAGSDPTVLLHELGHLILCGGVGGGLAQAPFETGGESAAVNEGLADLLGLLLWNHLRRAHTAEVGKVHSVGAWLFENGQRDYAFVATPGAGPIYPQGNTPHVKGMVLCGALLRLWQAIADAEGSAQLADDIVLRTVCASLAILPHQGPLPKFCCISKALRLSIGQQYSARLAAALADRNIPSTCPHITEV